MTDCNVGYIPSEPGSDSVEPLLPGSHDAEEAGRNPSRFSKYSETVIRMHGGNMRTSTPSLVPTVPDSGVLTPKPSAVPTAEQGSSVLTVRASPVVDAPGLPTLAPANPSAMSVDEARASKMLQVDTNQASRMSVDTYHTASSRINRPGGMPITDSAIMGSIAGATEGSTLPYDGALDNSPSYIHRFTLIKPGSGRKASISVSPSGRGTSPPPPEQAPGWSPFEFFFSSGLGAKCDLCSKRLGWGWKAVLECDDCGMR